jgi:N-acetylneuraminic acid mutarotase
MSKWRVNGFLIAMAGVLMLGGCGGGSASSSSPDPPTISALQIYPATAAFNSGGGTEFLSGALNFSDSGGNLSTLTIKVLDSNGNEIAKTTSFISYVHNITIGFVEFNGGVAPTNVAGSYTIQIFATDTAGGNSNILTSNFTVVDPPAWKAKKSMPTPRQGLAAVTVNNKIYTLGGFADGYALSSNEQYDPATDSWKPATPMPTARLGFAAAAVNGKIYAIGGQNIPAYSVLGTVEEYDPATGTWTSKAPMPTPRYELAAVELNGKIYAVGGTDNRRTPFTTVEEYDPVSNTWKSMANMSMARSALSAVAVNGKIYAIGGFSPAGFSSEFIATVEEYDPLGNAWTPRSNMPTARGWLSTASFNGRIYAFGGLTTGHISTQTEEYDPIANSWLTVTDMPSWRQSSGAAVVNGKVYVIGGFEYYSVYSNKTEEYDPLKEP